MESYYLEILLPFLHFMEAVGASVEAVGFSSSLIMSTDFIKDTIWNELYGIIISSETLAVLEFVGLLFPRGGVNAFLIFVALLVLPIWNIFYQLKNSSPANGFNQFTVGEQAIRTVVNVVIWAVCIGLLTLFLVMTFGFDSNKPDALWMKSANRMFLFFLFILLEQLFMFAFYTLIRGSFSFILLIATKIQQVIGQ